MGLQRCLLTFEITSPSTLLYSVLLTVSIIITKQELIQENVELQGVAILWLLINQVNNFDI